MYDIISIDNVFLFTITAIYAIIGSDGQLCIFIYTYRCMQGYGSYQCVTPWILLLLQPWQSI